MALVVLGTFIAVLGIVFGAYVLLVVRPEQQQSGAVRRRLRATRTRVAKADIGKSAEPLSTVGLLDTLLQRWSGLSAPLKLLIERAGLQMSVGALVLLSVFVGVVTASVWMWLSPYATPGLVLGVLVGTVPFVVVRHKATTRLALLEGQFLVA